MVITITICINLEGFNYVKMNVRLEGMIHQNYMAMKKN